MGTSEPFELKLGFSESRLTKIFAKYDPRCTGEKNDSFAAYAARTREIKEWLDGLKQKTLVDREDYFSRVKDAFEKLSSSLIALRAGVGRGRDPYELEGIARKHYKALLDLMELHKTAIAATVSRGIHTEENIDNTLTGINDQIERANQLFGSWLWRLSKKH